MSDADPEQIRHLAMEADIRRVSPARSRGGDPLHPVVVSVVRNEKARLQDFLAHYRGLGSAHFIIIDNGSSDGTREALANEPDIDLFETHESFSAARKHGWITRIVEEYGDRWYLLVDGDEHAVFDGAPDLRAIARAAERAGRRRVRGALLDMYGDGPIAGSGRNPGQMLLEAFPYFDEDGYEEKREVALTTRIGGPRKRVLSSIDPSFAPQLTKYPLFRLRPGDSLVSPHYIHPPLEGEDPCWIALLHYKFDGDVPARVADAVEQGQYWRDSYEYRIYRDGMCRFPGLSFMSDRSRRFRGAADLVDLGIIEKVKFPRGVKLLRKLSSLVRGGTR